MSRLVYSLLVTASIVGAALVHPVLALEAPTMIFFWRVTQPIRDDLRVMRYVAGKKRFT